MHECLRRTMQNYDRRSGGPGQGNRFVKFEKSNGESTRGRQEERNRDGDKRTFIARVQPPPASLALNLQCTFSSFPPKRMDFSSFLFDFWLKSSDAHEIATQLVSLSPLHSDLTAYAEAYTIYQAAAVRVRWEYSTPRCVYERTLRNEASSSIITIAPTSVPSLHFLHTLHLCSNGRCVIQCQVL